MSFLYLDTSNGISLGLLDEGFVFRKLKKIETKKTSLIVHSEILSLLNEFSLKLSNLTGVFISSGPGGYTGIRIAEGMAQILELESIKTWSFYNFDIISFLDFKDYVWCIPAFKGEILVKEKSLQLFKENTFHESFNNKKLITHGENELSSLCQENSEILIEKYSMKIFPYIVKNKLRVPPYYFRAVDSEFKKSSK